MLRQHKQQTVVVRSEMRILSTVQLPNVLPNAFA